MMYRGAAVAALLVFACVAAPGAPVVAAPGAGETAVDLHVVASPLPLSGSAPRTLVRAGTIRLPRAAADPALRVALTDDVLLYRAGDARDVNNTPVPSTVAALDPRSGRPRWRTRLGYIEPIAAAPALLYATAPNPRYGLTAIDLRSGRPVWSMRDLRFATRAGAKLLGTIGKRFVALDPLRGTLLWSADLGGIPSDDPVVVAGPVVLVKDGEEGAISHDVLYAFDLQTGARRWNTGHGWISLLGVRGDRVYELSGSPGDLDGYVPATIGWIDPLTGAEHNADYAPDPPANRRQNNPWTHDALVSGTYVFFTVNGKLYRYDLDGAPESAHPTRMPGTLRKQYAYHGDDAWYVDAGRVEVLRMSDPVTATRSVLDAVPRGVTLFRIDGDAAYAVVPRRGVWTIDLASARVVSVAPTACAQVRAVDATATSLFVTCDGAGGPALTRFAR